MYSMEKESIFLLKEIDLKVIWETVSKKALEITITQMVIITKVSGFRIKNMEKEDTLTF